MRYVIITVFVELCCMLQVDEVRQQTKAEKKRLAMAMREKQLGALGMAVGHVTILVDKMVSVIVG